MTAAAIVKRRALITTGRAEESTRDLMTACCVPHSSAHACSAKMASQAMWSFRVAAGRCSPLQICLLRELRWNCCGMQLTWRLYLRPL